MRLQKYLALAGVASRRRAEELIRAGRVRVNGQVITAMGVQVEPGKDRVAVDGRPVGLTEKKYYVLLYKPAGYVTTAADPRGRPKVTDLVRDIPARLYPVGRLDYATEGLLLLTNDGELTLRLTHPRYGVNKTYLALVRGLPDANTIAHLGRGVNLEDGPTAPARVHLRRAGKSEALLELTIREGRNREVRRMLAAVGHPVLHLRRTRLAFLTLAGLKPGTYRHLTPAEVEGLYRLVGLK
ncbi:pseudouridine synthase [Moorella sp. Hama-1]|uniref:pseudouridine synthase n=1 Tax=Moorella sp. Hama-1 TaxID=2138101 RepID=UPI000D65C1FC|nr:pseudouridine synthase [Moorella sp. Hama-1]BCV21514.1 pseudouridine synthase [Moorella sp. Hama-1]